MKKSGLLHRELSYLIASLGHGDLVVIGDAGLPAPPGVQVIDLAVTLGLPGFLDVLDAVLSEMQVEAAFRASEAGAIGRDMDGRLSVAVEQISHEDFKALSAEARAIIRTGEATPYANIGLVAGVVF
ncbi:MAG: D-ribose pyranase [Pseudomonadota bacterium]